MTATAIIAFIAGAILAQRFRIFILIPLLLLAAGAAIVAVLASAAGGWDFFFAAVAAVVGLQIGYLAGVVLRAWLPAPSEQTESTASDKRKSGSGVLPVH
jgi:hypothetical protein